MTFFHCYIDDKNNTDNNIICWYIAHRFDMLNNLL